MSDLERFLLHITVDPTSGCINWTGAKNKKGYGQFSVRRAKAEKANSRWGNRRVIAHKWLFEQIHGVVECGHEVDHKCTNPSCVNLGHLQVLTKAQNLALRGQVHF